MFLFRDDREADPPAIDVPRAILAGLAGSAAYLAAQAADIAATGDPTDDIKLVGMPFTRRSPWWRVVGLGVHFFNGAALGVLYAATAARWLPGPAWLRGLIFAEIENTSLWFALIRPIDKIHPAVRHGDLPSYDRAVPFWQGVGRHVAYGAVVGAIYGKGR